MTNGNERLERIERILERASERQDRTDEHLNRTNEHLNRTSERLDRLTERHEALAESVQLHDAAITRLEEAQRKNEILAGQTLEMINSLARIAQAHERRLDQLEGQ